MCLDLLVKEDDDVDGPAVADWWCGESAISTSWRDAISDEK